MKSLIDRAVKLTKAKGSSTFVMLTIDEEGDKINSLNLGDSGFMILRPNESEKSGFETVFRSKE